MNFVKMALDMLRITWLNVGMNLDRQIKQIWQSTKSLLKLTRICKQHHLNSCVGVFIIHLDWILSRFELIFDFLKFKIFQKINLNEVHKLHDKLQRPEFVGYAVYYLKQCWNESKSTNKADLAVYEKLIEIDTELGTTQSEQLLGCLCYSPRLDLIEV